MSMLTEAQWKALILLACDDDGTVSAQWDQLWILSAPHDVTDPSGQLRYLDTLIRALDLRLGDATRDVSGSDGGGQSGQWEQHFDHLWKLREQAKLDKEKLAKSLSLAASADLSIEAMTTVSLTPVLAGYIDPGHPVFSGDPRFRTL